MVKFGTKEYFQAWADLINKDADYLKLMKGMDAKMLLKFTGKPKFSIAYKYEDGKIVDLHIAYAKEKADFVLEGARARWAALAKKKLDVLDSVRSGKLKLKGPLTRALPYMKGIKYSIEQLDKLTGVEF